MLSEAWEKGRGGPGGGEIPATCENFQTQIITDGQPGYQEPEVALEQDQVMGDPCLLRDFHRTLDITISVKCHMALAVPKSTVAALFITTTINNISCLLEEGTKVFTICCEGVYTAKQSQF